MLRMPHFPNMVSKIINDSVLNTGCSLMSLCNLCFNIKDLCHIVSMNQCFTCFDIERLENYFWPKLSLWLQYQMNLSSHWMETWRPWHFLCNIRIPPQFACFLVISQLTSLWTTYKCKYTNILESIVIRFSYFFLLLRKNI